MNETVPAPMSFLMLGAVHEIEAHLETALGGIGLSLAKFRTLSHLAELREPVPLSALADRCSCVRSNMTQLVDRLEADRLVERVSDPADRRSVRAALTEEGWRRHAEGVRVLAEVESQLFSRLQDADRAALARLIQLVKPTDG
jgi:DNA-binding MarR family transcriptional regulator